MLVRPISEEASIVEFVDYLDVIVRVRQPDDLEVYMTETVRTMKSIA